jgi:hypothetical protein
MNVVATRAQASAAAADDDDVRDGDDRLSLLLLAAASYEHDRPMTSRSLMGSHRWPSRPRADTMLQ